MLKSLLESILALKLHRSARLMFYLILPLFITISCNKDKLNTTPSNKITLSSKTFGTIPYYPYGYSFEKQAFFQRIVTSSDIDIYLNELLNTRGELTGVEFSTNTISESTYGFYLNEEFANLAAAEEFYTNYSEAYFPEYVSLTDTIKLFQVYTFRTWKKNYVKFLVKDIRVYNKVDLADYIEVDIEYFIQRDGSVNLTN